MILNTIKYSLKIWLTSVLVAPIIYILVQHFTSQTNAVDAGGNAELYLMIVAFSAIFSLITWIIFTLIIAVLHFNLTHVILKKTLIAVFGMSLTVATFLLTFLQGDIHSNDMFLLLMIYNCVCIGGGSWFYRLKPVARMRIA